MKNEEIIAAFNRLKDDKSMHNEIYETGCIQRTGIALEKIPGTHYVVFMGADGKDIKCKDNGVVWKQHYVPVVEDESGKSVVLDTSLLDGPESLAEYVKHFENMEMIISPEYGFGLRELDDYNADKAHIFLEELATSGKYTVIKPNMVKSKWLENPTETVQEESFVHGISDNMLAVIGDNLNLDDFKTAETVDNVNNKISQLRHKINDKKVLTTDEIRESIQNYMADAKTENSVASIAKLGRLHQKQH